MNPQKVVTYTDNRIYDTKEEASAAARDAIGKPYAVDAPEFDCRFSGKIIITEKMLFVGRAFCCPGWRWSYTFELGEVLVEVPATKDVYDESTLLVPYKWVKHWPDSSEPCGYLMEG